MKAVFARATLTRKILSYNPGDIFKCMKLRSHSGNCFNFEGEGVTESKFQLQM